MQTTIERINRRPMIPADASGYFEALYHAHEDPWHVGARWYEQRKRQLLLAALPHARFAYAYEPGCGSGVLTAALAQRCDRLLASDFSDTAVQIAGRRLASAPHVEICRQAVPREWPAAADAVFDLIVISEFGYYMPAADLSELARRTLLSLRADGCLVLCHWLHPFAERLHETATVHAVFDQQPALTQLARYRDDDFLLEVWSRDGHSVAAQEGLA